MENNEQIKKSIKAMTQEQIDEKIKSLRLKKAEHRYKIQFIESEIVGLTIKMKNLNDPHAVIPKQYKTIEDWLENHPFPNAVNAMRCKNKLEAENVLISCMVYRESYHIVKC
jgi:hypothetical protein